MLDNLFCYKFLASLYTFKGLLFIMPTESCNWFLLNLTNYSTRHCNRIFINSCDGRKEIINNFYVSTKELRD